MLEEVKMAPVAPDPVMNALPVHAARRARQVLRIAGNLEIDPPFGRIEVDLAHSPRRFQSQRGRKQGFDTNTHCGFLKSKQGQFCERSHRRKASAWSSPRHAMSTAMPQRIGPTQRQGFASPACAARSPPLTLLRAKSISAPGSGRSRY